MTFLIVKYVHILGAIVLFGVGLGTAFQMWRAHASGNPQIVSYVGRNVVLADWLFTAPAIILQPITGLILAYQMGLDLGTSWLWLSIALFVFTGMCWLPVLWLQIRMARIAESSVRVRTALPETYYLYARIWFWLGWPAFIAMLAILFLMLYKPYF